MSRGGDGWIRPGALGGGAALIFIKLLIVLCFIWQPIYFTPIESGYYSIFIRFLWLLCTELNMFGCSFVVEFAATAWAGYSGIFLYYFILNFLSPTLFNQISQYFTLVLPLRLILFLLLLFIPFLFLIFPF